MSGIIARIAPASPNSHNFHRMVDTVIGRESTAAPAALRDDYISAFRWMLLARTLDDKLASLYRGGKIVGGVFLGLSVTASAGVRRVGLATNRRVAKAVAARAGAFGRVGREGFGVEMGLARRIVAGARVEHAQQVRDGRDAPDRGA